jgi:hypothetical protein
MHPAAYGAWLERLAWRARDDLLCECERRRDALRALLVCAAAFEFVVGGESGVAQVPFVCVCVCVCVCVVCIVLFSLSLSLLF